MIKIVSGCLFALVVEALGIAHSNFRTWLYSFWLFFILIFYFLNFLVLFCLFVFEAAFLFVALELALELAF